MNTTSPDAQSIAAALIEAGCVSVRTDEPFRLPSGWASPVYMDCRRIISFPALRRRIVDAGIAQLRDRGALQGLDAIVGGEASGIALAAWIADNLDLPLLYVRKKAAGKTQVEGSIAPGAKVLLVDDLIAAGHSKLRFVKALQGIGAKVPEAFVVFDYGVFGNRKLLEPLHVRLHALATWRDVLAAAKAANLLPKPALRELDQFLHDPVGWSGAHGGVGATSEF